jgi:hypothetical protein
LNFEENHEVLSMRSGGKGDVVGNIPGSMLRLQSNQCLCFALYKARRENQDGEFWWRKYSNNKFSYTKN